MRPQRFHYIGPIFGMGVCTLTASTLCVLLQRSSVKPWVPLYFLAVIVIVAFRFGALAGMLGTAMAAAIFALFLFEPLRSLAVHNVDARNNLICLLLFGVAVSELCGHPPPPGGQSTATKITS